MYELVPNISAFYDLSYYILISAFCWLNMEYKKMHGTKNTSASYLFALYYRQFWARS